MFSPHQFLTPDSELLYTCRNQLDIGSLSAPTDGSDRQSASTHHQITNIYTFTFCIITRPMCVCGLCLCPHYTWISGTASNNAVHRYTVDGIFQCCSPATASFTDICQSSFKVKEREEERAQRMSL
jgi:hypothetical protein